MNDLILYGMLGGIVLLFVIQLILFKQMRRIAKGDNPGEKLLYDVFEKQNKEISSNFSDIRNELRAVSKENRSEIGQAIANNAEAQKTSLDLFSKSLNELSEKLLRDSVDFKEKVHNYFIAFNETIRKDGQENRKDLNEGLKAIETNFHTNISNFQEQLKEKFTELNEQQQSLNTLSNNAIRETKEATEKQLISMREDNEKQLREMRQTVDEKLQDTLEKRLGESFKQVSERLEVVHKGLGEMQTIATGVGDLKKVLANVKTRGILGEYQLGNILEQLLSPQQYAKNVATKKGSQAHVEYAIKLPGKNADEEVWIPVDSKFPIEGYNRLLDAFDGSNTKDIEQAQKELLKTIDLFARDISDKYIDPPHTTEFGIMFLPVEGLFAEVLRHPGLLEKLQRQYHITVTGPTTFSAFLNSLQMGYKTLAIQKRSSEVWKILSAVKTEFGKFSDQLTRVHKQLNTATSSLDALKGTRLNVMNRKLQGVETMTSVEASEILELPESDDMASEKNNGQ
jgi:DNA recombination protein RmuC